MITVKMGPEIEQINSSILLRFGDCKVMVSGDGGSEGRGEARFESNN